MRRRIEPSLLVSLAVHVVLGAGLVWLVTLPNSFTALFEREPALKNLPVERIGFITLPRGPETRAGRSGGDNRPVSPAKPEPRPLVAPSEVPTGVPPAAAPPATPAPEPGGSGPLVGAGGPTAGVRPSYSDPRLWVAPGPVVSAPGPAAEHLDSALAARIRAHNDSLALLAAGARKPGDWTFERGGKKYGIDQKYIHLGDFQIPTAVLAMLPLNVQANPTALERERQLNAMHSDIAFQAQRAMNEEDFRAAVKRIRERKDRERAEAAAKARETAAEGQGEVPANP